MKSDNGQKAARELLAVARESAVVVREAAAAVREAAVAAREAAVAEREAAFIEMEAAAADATSALDQDPAVRLDDGRSRLASPQTAPAVVSNAPVAQALSRRRDSEEIGGLRHFWLHLWATWIKEYHGNNVFRWHYLAVMVFHAGELFDRVDPATVAAAVGFSLKDYEYSWACALKSPECAPGAGVPEWCLRLQMRRRNPDSRYVNGGHKFILTQLAQVLKAIVDDHQPGTRGPASFSGHFFLQDKYTTQSRSAHLKSKVAIDEWMRLLLGVLEGEGWIRRKNACPWANDPDRLNPAGYEPGLYPVLMPDDLLLVPLIV